MITRKIETQPTQLAINGQTLKQASHFKFLGSSTNKEMTNGKEKRARIYLARRAFINWKPTFTDRGLAMHTRLKVLRCYDWNVLLYSCETWTIKTNIMNQIEAFEMWFYRRILKTPWTSHTSNEEEFSSNYQILSKWKKLVTLEDKYDILCLIIQEKDEGKRLISRKKIPWLRNIRNWTTLGFEKFFRAASNRDQFNRIVVEIANSSVQAGHRKKKKKKTKQPWRPELW